jgi:hypothetical protein
MNYAGVIVQEMLALYGSAMLELDFTARKKEY